jgi:hypothetical protein
MPGRRLSFRRVWNNGKARDFVQGSYAKLHHKCKFALHSYNKEDLREECLVRRVAVREEVLPTTPLR